jgi:alginate O-acetyltransferase complex protein AlgI
MWDTLREINEIEPTAFGAFLSLAFFAFQIYFDFSGYSDMAIGLGKIFGFDFPENFNYPYTAKSITEFWRRWHITLSTWFKEYVYIPLGGNRRGTGRLIFNLLVVWLLTGLWHGASWNFVLWGLYYFVLLVVEKLFLSKWLEKLPSVISHLYALFFIVLGWLIFYFKPSVGGFVALSSYFTGMFGFLNLPFVNGELGYMFVRNFLLILTLCLACTPYPKNLFLKIKDKINNENKKMIFNILFDIILVAMFVLCVVYISSSEYRPNIYYEF